MNHPQNRKDRTYMRGQYDQEQKNNHKENSSQENIQDYSLIKKNNLDAPTPILLPYQHNSYYTMVVIFFIIQK